MPYDVEYHELFKIIVYNLNGDYMTIDVFLNLMIEKIDFAALNVFSLPKTNIKK